MERQVPVARGCLTTVSATPPGTASVSKASRSSKARASGGQRNQPRDDVQREPTDDDVATAPAMPDPVMLLRELNHRVKNNFQIIVSLMNLRKRMMPPERREDIRFIEEHVQSLSVAYRLVYATGSMIEVSLTELITEGLSGLRQIAGLREEQLQIEIEAGDALIGLDNAIALALYLAILMPPYFDQAIAVMGTVTISVALVAKTLTLTVQGTWSTLISLDLLRARLMRAYAAQLNAEIMPAARFGTDQLRFTIGT